MRVGNVRQSSQVPGCVLRRLRAPVLAALVPLLVSTPTSLSARDIILRPVPEAQRSPSPLLLLISIRKQRVRIFDDTGEIGSSRISSGQPGFDTPTGVFSILEKNQTHYSNIYGGAPMPFMQRLTWSGIALHAGVVPGYRASHGCIRLPHSFAKTLFGITRTGGRVVVAQDEMEPTRFDHANLFKPLPAYTTKVIGALSNGETKVAANDMGSDQLSVMPHFPGVSPAMAEAMPNALPASQDGSQIATGRPRSRAEADRFMSEKISNLQGALKAAETAKVAAGEKAKIVLKETEAAMATLASERKAIEAVRATVKAAEQKQAQAVRSFEAYMKGAVSGAVAAAGPVTKASARSGDKRGDDKRSEDKETDLEDAILDLTIEADAVRDGAARREMAFAEVQGSLSKADAARSAAIAAVSSTQIQLKSLTTALIDANKEQVRRAKPLAVFVSLKSKRVYIRQGFEPVLEAPIPVETPAAPVGTHVLTAMRYGADPNAFEWRLVSAHTPAAGTKEQTSKKNKRRDANQPQLPASAGPRLAKAALDAIQLPQDIRDTIAELARPGASFIISDRDMSANESGPGTEFVVLTR